jgi:polyketide cyclase/dehydrase/lipid transport protein
MNSQTATASQEIHAPAQQIYDIIADYRNMHPLILPKGYFLSLNVEEGGFGAGTIVNFTMRLLGRTQRFRSLITEPEPGRLLVETDLESEIPTSFLVEPTGDRSTTRVTISTELKGSNWVEGLIAKRVLQKIYRQELELLARLAEDPAALSSFDHPDRKERME